MISALARRLKAGVFHVIPSSRLMVRGPTSIGRRVALTFDDGPDERTIDYLDLLDELGVRATFFVTGNNSSAKPDLVREYIKRGHQIAGHGYDHQPFTKLRGGALVEQLDRTNAAIGRQPTARPWVRPPYGRLNARVLARLLAHGSMIAMWSFDSHDYEIKDPDALVARCAPEHIAPGDVLLFHEGQQWTLDAMPRIVGQLRGAGYDFVTMAEMIGE